METRVVKYCYSSMMWFYFKPPLSCFVLNRRHLLSLYTFFLVQIARLIIRSSSGHLVGTHKSNYE